MRSVERGDVLHLEGEEFIVRGIDASGVPIAGRLSLNSLQQAATVLKRMHGNLSNPDNLRFLRSKDRSEVGESYAKFVKELFNVYGVNNPEDSTVEDVVITGGYSIGLELDKNDQSDPIFRSSERMSEEGIAFTKRCPFEGYARVWEKAARRAMENRDPRLLARIYHAIRNFRRNKVTS